MHEESVSFDGGNEERAFEEDSVADFAWGCLLFGCFYFLLLASFLGFEEIECFYQVSVRDGGIFSVG